MRSVLAGMLLAGAALFPIVQGCAVRRAAAPQPEPGWSPRAVLEEKCSRCHDLGRVYSAIDDPAAWVRTVMAMSGKDGTWIPPEALRVIVRYRQLHGDYVRDLFDSTCGACHSWRSLRSMEKTASQWRTEVTYMARRCSTLLEDHEREAIVRALAGSPGEASNRVLNVAGNSRASAPFRSHQASNE